MSPKVFFLIIIITVVGAIVFLESKKKKVDVKQTPQELEHWTPSEPTPDPGEETLPESGNEEISADEVTPDSDFSEPPISQTPTAIPISPEEKAKEDEQVQEAIKNSPAPEKYEIPTEKGKPWTNPYEVIQPSN